MMYMKSSRDQGDERLGRARVDHLSRAERDSVQGLFQLVHEAQQADAAAGVEDPVASGDDAEQSYISHEVALRDGRGHDIEPEDVVHALELYLTYQIDRRPPTAA